MKRLRSVAYVLVAVIILLFAGQSEANTVICHKVRPITLRWMQGRVVDQLGSPVPQASVDLLRNEMVLASVQTNDDGRFSFQDVKAGNYELRAEYPGFISDQYPVVLKKPTSSWKGLAEMGLGLVVNCPNARVVKG